MLSGVNYLERSTLNYPERCGQAVIIAPPATSAASVTLHVHLQDCCVMDQAVDGGHRHGLVREHLIPFGERRVGRDGDALALIALGYELEPHRCLGLVPLGIAEVIKHQQVEAVELGQLGGRAVADLGVLPADAAPVRWCGRTAPCGPGR